MCRFDGNESDYFINKVEKCSAHTSKGDKYFDFTVNKEDAI